MCLHLSSELQGTYCVPEIMLTAYYTPSHLFQQQSFTHIIDTETEDQRWKANCLGAHSREVELKSEPKVSMAPTKPWPETRKEMKTVVSSSGAKGVFLFSQFCSQPNEETCVGPGQRETEAGNLSSQAGCSLVEGGS